MTVLFEDLFTRNIGVLSPEELEILKASTVALAGVGGVGGIQLVCLARTGIGNFSIADPEKFQSSDVNRQYGATVSTIGLKKVDVLATIVRDINPHATLQLFPSGVTEHNMDEFTNNADIVIDAIEYFALDKKVLLARKARKQHLHLVTSPTWGYGASLVVFSPDSMTFEQFFGTESHEEFIVKGKRYADRLFPIKPRYLDPYPYGDDMLEGRKPASVLCLGTLLSAALVVTETLAILLDKRLPVTAPRIIQVDLFRRSFDIVDLSLS
ncbi:MAG: ThiF family adenylyltransferase [Candidatus Methanofastidiosia archaeon]